MPLRLSRAYVGTMIFLFGVGVAFVVLVTWAPFAEGTRWRWSDTLASYAFSALVLFALGWSIHRNRRTEIAQECISQPTLFGVRRLAWKEVEKVGVSPTHIALVGSGKKVSVITGAYQESQAVAEYILSRVREARNQDVA